MGSAFRLGLPLLSGLMLGACSLPFGLGLPTTRELEDGATASLASPSFEVKGTFSEGADAWKLDLQEAGTIQHFALQSDKVSLEAILTPKVSYFRGQQFLASRLGSDQRAKDLVRAAGNSWWKSAPDTGELPRLAELIQPLAFSQAFLGSAASSRHDGVSTGGVSAVELSGPRADVYIAADSPHRLIRLRTKSGVTVDGLASVDFTYGSYGVDFKLAAPTDVVDFSDLSTLPPLYSVVSVDTSGCASPCVVTATISNLGGRQPASGPSTVTFTMTDSASGRTIGVCQTAVRPDVGFNQTKVVGCEIALVSGSEAAGATVTAVATNPGRGS